MVGLVTFIVLNLEVNQVLVRSGKGKTNLVQLGKNLREGKKQSTRQTLKGNPDEEERERSPCPGKLSGKSYVLCCFSFPQVSTQLSLNWVRPYHLI